MHDHTFPLEISPSCTASSSLMEKSGEICAFMLGLLSGKPFSTVSLCACVVVSAADASTNCQRCLSVWQVLESVDLR